MLAAPQRGLVEVEVASAGEEERPGWCPSHELVVLHGGHLCSASVLSTLQRCAGDILHTARQPWPVTVPYTPGFQCPVGGECVRQRCTGLAWPLPIRAGQEEQPAPMRSGLAGALQI